MSKKFAGKIAVVTGGSTGMGLATAKRFVQQEWIKEGIIRAADVNADYTIHPEPSETLKALRVL